MVILLKNKVKMEIDEIKSGMILASDIVSEDTVLVTRGAIITDILIKKLKEKYILNNIEVFTSDNYITDSVNQDKAKAAEDIQKSFNMFSSNVENIFHNINNGNISDLTEVENFAKKIKEDMNSTRDVIKNIVFYGSGEDTIYRHSVNVAALSSILGSWLGLTVHEIDLLTYSAILHDFGKTKISNDVLNKLGNLTKNDFKEIKKHPVLAYTSLKKVPNLDSSVSLGVLMHHERLDGSGYPFGIKQDQIHIFAKIIAIADTFDAINSNRSYKKSRGPFEALEVIQKESLGKLDYEYCKVFLQHIINYYIGESVLLNSNNICKIIYIDINALENPLLIDGLEFIDLKQRKDLYIETLVL